MDKAPITFLASLKAWDSPAFEEIFKEDMRRLERGRLPLQAALTQSSYVSDQVIEPIILQCSDTGGEIRVKAGIFYGGIVAGSCCADDPSPDCEQTEYCELLVIIDKTTAHSTIDLIL